MGEYNIIRICDNRELIDRAAQWFHEKWNIPKDEYLQSMDESLHTGSGVPSWYVVMDEGNIIAGIGVIENDFHDRKDLAPNVCAVYVEREYRGRGIAGDMLKFVCGEFKNKAEALYLVTDHTSFYERYGWEFLCMVQCDGEPDMSRMYIYRL